MTKPVTLSFKSFPSVLKMYPSMLSSRKPSLVKEGKTYPRLEGKIENITADPKHVAQFAKVCGFATASETLPLPYPHVLAAPLHYAILNHAKFPLKLLGLVHVSNSITQHRPIGLQEVMDVECFIEGFDDTPKGQIFHMQTRINVQDELVWEETTSFIARKKSKKKSTRDKKSTSVQKDRPNAKITSWEVPNGLGRKFAKVSGDVNPIHLTDVSAKLFGFKKAIIHGVWTMSRTMAELEPVLAQSAKGLNNLVFSVNFKLPVFMPCWVSLESYDSDTGLDFTLKDSAGEKPHMSGSLTYL